MCIRDSSSKDNKVPPILNRFMDGNDANPKAKAKAKVKKPDPDDDNTSNMGEVAKLKVMELASGTLTPSDVDLGLKWSSKLVALLDARQTKLDQALYEAKKSKFPPSPKTLSEFKKLTINMNDGKDTLRKAI
eukprot:2724760-Alexandrium_andersonii.AAC.1